MFAAHLPGDPCLPGFLLLEAALQALSFHLTALGVTLARDGWRFEPLRDRRYACAFRGQITPQSTRLVYEVFVESLVCDAEPHIVADVSCSLDGRPVFHARRLALGLVPDWPLEQFRLGAYAANPLGAAGPLAALGGLAGYPAEATPAATVERGINSDYPAVLALCWGRAQDAFGERVAVYDGATRWPRLPAPPFLFLSRITRIEAEMGKARPGVVDGKRLRHPRSGLVFPRERPSDHALRRAGGIGAAVLRLAHVLPRAGGRGARAATCATSTAR